MIHEKRTICVSPGWWTTPRISPNAGKVRKMPSQNPSFDDWQTKPSDRFVLKLMNCGDRSGVDAFRLVETMDDNRVLHGAEG